MPELEIQSKRTPVVSVILLNWNGYTDTIECMESLAACTGALIDIVLVDNASTDGSVEYIRKRIAQGTAGQGARGLKIVDEILADTDRTEIIPVKIIINSENTGFAKGNNTGIRYALKYDPDHILLLNNDTVADKHFIERMLDFFAASPDHSVVTPQIRYYDKPEIVWNCGGKLTATGSRSYFYDDISHTHIPFADHIDITFITGCALMARTKVFREYGLLTEAFFFGEEDYEFSLRMKKNKLHMACVPAAVIFHKVNSSISKASAVATGKIFIHYLNRFINLRNYYSPARWQVWRHTYMLYVALLLKRRHNVPNKVICKFRKDLLRDSAQLKGVDKQTFEKYINYKFD